MRVTLIERIEAPNRWLVRYESGEFISRIGDHRIIGFPEHELIKGARLRVQTGRGWIEPTVANYCGPLNRVLPPCGDPSCGSSSFIDERMTFGSGDLCELGMFEHPCSICARNHDAKREETAQRVYADLLKSHGPDWAYKYMIGADWIFEDAYPLPAKPKE